MTEKESPDSGKESLLSETVVLAISSAAAYFFAFKYESAYIGYFGAPEELASVDLKTVIGMAASLFALLIFIFPIVNLVLTLVPTSSRVARYILLKWGWPLLMLAIFIVSVGINEWREWLLLVAFLTVWVALDFAPALFTRRKSGSYWQRLVALEEEESEKVKGSIMMDFARKLEAKVWVLMLLLLTAWMITPWLGKLSARTKQEFLVIKGKPEQVVIRVYGNNALVASLVRKEQRTLKVFRVLNLEANSGLPFALEEIGPLKPRTEALEKPKPSKRKHETLAPASKGRDAAVERNAQP